MAAHTANKNARIAVASGAGVLAALYQKILELAQGIGQQAPGRNGGSGGYGRGGGGFGNNTDDGIAQKGEGLLLMLAELDITQQSYSQHLQALLMHVSLAGGGCVHPVVVCYSGRLWLPSALTARSRAIASTCRRC